MTRIIWALNRRLAGVFSASLGRYDASQHCSFCRESVSAWRCEAFAVITDLYASQLNEIGLVWGSSGRGGGGGGVDPQKGQSLRTGAFSGRNDVWDQNSSVLVTMGTVKMGKVRTIPRGPKIFRTLGCVGGPI